MRIEFEGNALFASESLKVLMRLKEGDRLDPVKLDQDMALLFRFFDSVRVTQEPVPGGVVLHFVVSENPLVVELNIYGADAIPTNEIRQMMSTRVGFPLFPYTLATDAEDIVQAYRQKGYYFAQVPEPVITTLEGGGRRVDFTVVEGPEVEVDKILFRGNAHVSRTDLLDVMHTSEEGPIPFLSDAPFRMDVLEEDLIALKRRVEDEGFLDAEVVLDDLRFSDDRARVVITIGITEHQPYTVGEIEIHIDRVGPGEVGSPPPEDVAYFTKDRIRSWLGLVPGQRYAGKCERAGIERITDEYKKRSYIDVSVPPAERRGHERQNVVDLVLEVHEGPKTRLRRLDFRGNEYTRDKVLRREARMSPGGYIDSRELDRTLARLRGLGYFDRVSLDVQDARTASGDEVKGWKDVTYEVVEGSTGQLNFGVGISTDGGLFGNISFTKHNFDITRWPTSLSELFTRRAFTGAGQTFEVLLGLGSQQSQAAVAFSEPHLFGTDLGLDLQAYKRGEFWEDYDVDRLGYAVGLRYPLFVDPEDRLRVGASLTWRQDDVDVNDVGSRAVPGAFLFQGGRDVRVLSGRFTVRTVDDIAKPTFSTFTALKADLGGTVLGGQVDFVRLDGNTDLTWILFRDQEGRRHRLTVKGRVGWSRALEDTSEVPPYERFYAGGSGLRGFAYRGVGPHVNGRPTGGEWLVAHTIEYEYPLIENTLGIVAFLDGGTVGTNVWEHDAFRWRLSAGVGLRITIPALGPRPLALDFGIPFLREDQDERQLVSFSIGRDF